MDELIDSLPTQHQRDAANEIIDRAGTSDADWQVIKSAAELLAVEREARACDKAYRLERAAELVAGDYEPGGNLDPAKLWPDGTSHGTCCDQMQAKLAAETMRAGEYQQERDQALDLATEMRKRADSLSKNYGRVVGELNSALADRDRLREVLRTIHRMSPTDNTLAGVVKFAAGLQTIAHEAINTADKSGVNLGAVDHQTDH